MITLAAGFGPESVVEPVQRYWRTEPAGPVHGIHFFTFGREGKAAAWLREHHAGKRHPRYDHWFIKCLVGDGAM